MTEVELYNELQNVEGCLKIADSQITEIRKKKDKIMNDFLSLLPFQEGDKVKDKNGNKLFVVDGITVYRFYDSDRVVYFTNKKGVAKAIHDEYAPATKTTRTKVVETLCNEE